MRKCVLLFLLLVFALIIASVTENRERKAANEEVAIEMNTSESLLEDSATLGSDLTK